MAGFQLVIMGDTEQHVEVFDLLAECVNFAKETDLGMKFEIHRDKGTHDYLRGTKDSSGYIDWVRTLY